MLFRSDDFGKIFSCKDHNDLVSEFLFLISNLYSSQDNFEKSNFYLNLSNYLNPKFEFNLSLVAENFYLNDEFDKVQRILKNFKKEDEFYYWFRLKKEAQIIIQEQDYENGIKYIDSKFNKIENPNIKMIFDLANFYKNSKNYEKAIDRYTEIILTLDDNSLIKSDVLYFGWLIAYDSFKVGRTSSTILDVPSFLTEFAIPLCFGFLVIYQTYDQTKMRY